jgi:RNA-binding protein
MSPSRNLIVRIESTAHIGERVVDENLRPVGKIFDLFGPVSSPYVSVKPVTANIGELAGRMVYVVPSERRKEKRVNERTRRRT